MFGLGMGEIILIAVVALLVIGPDKLPDAARTIGRGIRDFRKQTRDLQDTIENDAEIGGAVRELRSALRGDPEAFRSPVQPAPPRTPGHSGALPGPDASAIAGAAPAASASAAAGAPAAAAAGTAAAAEPLDADASAAAADADPDLPVLRSPGGTVARGSEPEAEPGSKPGEGGDPKDSAHG